MPKILTQFLLICLLISSTSVMAKQVLKIGVGNFPPFFIEKEQKGIFIEITNEIFKHLPEYSVQYIFMSNNRLLHEINSGKRIDAACNIFADSEVNAYLSEPIFRYRDVAISKKSSGFIVNQISDLQDKSIAAYQGAKDLLGRQFKEMAIKNPNYSEHAHPKETTYLMLSDNKDIRVGDINIFWHDLNRNYFKENKKIDVNNFNIHTLWPDVYSHIAFKDKALKNAVNKIIAELKLNGKIEEIYNKNQVKYPVSL
ncbi:MAG: transporter substrate-binding domain-containing protein [Colwellia sp.]|nr:transporter substrate-binding domain-containing protein [Colwellia sp.]